MIDLTKFLCFLCQEYYAIRLAGRLKTIAICDYCNDYCLDQSFEMEPDRPKPRNLCLIIGAMHSDCLITNELPFEWEVGDLN
jgi:hypothetical protein